MATSQSDSASAGDYFTNLYNRAANMINHTASGRPDEQRPLLHGQSSSSADYGSVPVPKPKKVSSPVKVEAKVWFANERTWISWLRASILMGTLSLALFNSASYYDPEPVVPPFEPGPALAGKARAARTVRTFGVVYALISVMVLLWGLYNYQRRVTLIKSKWPGSFGTCLGSRQMT